MKYVIHSISLTFNKQVW